MVPVDALTGTISCPDTGALNPVSPPEAHPDPHPPPEPPPVTSAIDSHTHHTVAPLPCPPGSILEHITGQASQPSIIVDLSYNADTQTSATDIAPLISIPNSVTDVMCTPRVCGLRGNAKSSVTICAVKSGHDRMVDGGSNVCVTGDIGSLLDVIDINPIPILVAIEGSASSSDNRITKQGVLPLSLSDGTTYFQMCYYCANMVETIISPAAVLASSDVFFSWTQEGIRNPTIPGSLRFTSHDGLLSMHFPLRYHAGLYYCDTNVYTVDRDPVRLTYTRTTATPTRPQAHRPAPKFVPTTLARQVESEVWALRFGSPGEGQLDALPHHVYRIPPVFEYHPFRLILKSKPTYGNNLPGNLPNAYLTAAVNFSWTLASCTRRTMTTDAPTKPLIGLFSRIMAIARISSLSMAHHVKSGSSSRRAKPPPLRSFALS